MSRFLLLEEYCPAQNRREGSRDRSLLSMHKTTAEGSRNHAFLTGWRPVVILLSLCAVVYLIGLGNRPLWDGDEGLHAATSRDMVLTGNWITPYANGESFFDKPAFFNWLVAASFTVFGFTEFAARLPAAVVGTASVLALWFFGSRIFDRMTGFFSAVALATSVQFVILSRTIVHDIALALFIICTLGSFFVAFSKPEKERTPWMLSVYFFSGFGVLAKGPIGVLLPGMVIFLFLLFQRRLDFILRARLITGTIVFLVVATPWYIAVALQNPDYVERFFLGTNFGYFFGNDADAGHPKPWHHYIPALLGGMFPWSLLLPGALIRAFRRHGEDKMPDSTRFTLVWTCSIFLFFTAATSKLGTYITPMFPAAALLVGKLWRDLISETANSPKRPKFAIPLGFIAVVCALALIVFLVRPVEEWHEKYGVNLKLINVLAVIMTVLTTTMFLAFLKRYYLASFGILAAVPSVALLFFVLMITPFINPFRSVPALSHKVDGILPEGDPIICFGDKCESVLFYTHRQFERWDDEEKLLGYFAGDERAAALVDHRRLAGFERQPEPLYMLGREGHMLLISNHEAPAADDTHLVSAVEAQACGCGT